MLFIMASICARCCSFMLAMASAGMVMPEVFVVMVVSQVPVFTVEAVGGQHRKGGECSHQQPVLPDLQFHFLDSFPVDCQLAAECA